MKRDSRLSMALHTLLHMAEEPSAVTSEVLGKRMDTNPVVIRRTMAGLRDAGLLESVKGHGGGWSVARDLKDISLLDVYTALDEPVLIQQHRGIENPKCIVEEAVEGALGEAFAEAEALIKTRFAKVKLSDLSKKFHARMVEKHGKGNLHGH